MEPNHHHDQQHFGGPIGAALGLAMMVDGRALGRRAIRLAEVGEGSTVLDIGCGPGTAVRAAAALARTAIGVDPSGMMLRIARTVPTRADNVDWREGVAEHLPVDDASVDAAWSIRTVHHWPDVNAGIAELHRVLSRDGRFVALERPRKPGSGLGSHGWFPEQADTFAQRCVDAGMSDAEVVADDDHTIAVVVRR